MELVDYPVYFRLFVLALQLDWLVLCSLVVVVMELRSVIFLSMVSSECVLMLVDLLYSLEVVAGSLHHLDLVVDINQAPEINRK